MEENWLTAQVDAYCERLGPGLWAEPWNAVTNLAFLLAALLCAHRLRGTGLARGWALVVLLAAIGIGSGLFHTFATGWAGMADTLPILVFILVYVHAASRDFLGLSRLAALGSVIGAFAALPLVGAGARALVPAIGGTSGYLAVPLLLCLYAWLLRARAPATARALALGAGLVCLSLTARWLDAPICTALPRGTHFLWHLMNALLLGWLIETYRRHMLAGRAPRR